MEFLCIPRIRQPRLELRDMISGARQTSQTDRCVRRADSNRPGTSAYGCERNACAAELQKFQPSSVSPIVVCIRRGETARRCTEGGGRVEDEVATPLEPSRTRLGASRADRIGSARRRDNHMRNARRDIIPALWRKNDSPSYRHRFLSS